MEDFSTTVGIVALAGCALAVIALLCSLFLLLRLRRLRAAGSNCGPAAPLTSL